MKKLVVLIALVVLSSIALADDIQPPWWRNQWSTTFQYWEFSTNANLNVKPDGPGPLDEGPPYVSGYLPSTEIILIEPGPGMDWIDIDSSGRQGIWPLSGIMDVIVDNHDPPNEWKIMWVQITWRPQDQGMVPVIENLVPAPHQDYPVSIVEEELLADGWFETTFTWRISPNPVDEMFRISGSIDVDELVIDTWCIPEPATLMLLAFGGLLLRKRK
jgi:hypothetical protein